MINLSSLMRLAAGVFAVGLAVSPQAAAPTMPRNP